LAAAINCGAYDALYLALAVRLGTAMITADERLANTVAGVSAAASHIRSLQDFQTQ